MRLLDSAQQKTGGLPERSPKKNLPCEMERDQILLASSWAMTLTASTLITSAGPLAAKSAGAGNALAPFTVGAFLFGAALVSGPSDRMFERWGRRGGFYFGCGVGSAGGLLGAGALEFGGDDVWPAVIAACFLIGISQGVGQFLRFAASELCQAEAERARAVTLCLSGGVVAAFAGPQAAVHSRTVPPLLTVTFSGCFMLVVFANIINVILLFFVNFKDVRRYPTTNDDDILGGGSEISVGENASKELAEALLTAAVDYSEVASESSQDASSFTTVESDGSRSGGSRRREEVSRQNERILTATKRRRTALEILAQPRCACAVSVASLAHTSMVMLMSCLTLAMDAEGYPFQLTCLTLELHFLSMYAPGLLGSSTFIRRAGPYLASVAGLAFYAVSATILASGRRLPDFIVGMALCGIAWNLCFSSGTVLLTTCYTSDESLMVQAVNDLIIFGLAGSGSFASGYIYAALGWENLIYIVAAIMALFAIILGYALLINRKQQQQQQRKTKPSLVVQNDDTTGEP